MGKRPFCVKGGEIIGNVPTIEELAVYIKEYILNEGYSASWASDAIKGATRQAIYNMHQTVVGQLEYKGLWDASSGDYPDNPELGWYYVVSVAGETGGVFYRIGDWIIWNGTGWDKLAGKADVYPIGAQFNYFGIGIKGDIATRDYEISMANGDDFDMKGWFVANGQAGTPTCGGKFTRSTYTSGTTGGSNDAIVVEHSHVASSENAGEHVHQTKYFPSGAVSKKPYNEECGSASDLDWDSEPAGVHLHQITVENEGISGVTKNIPLYISSIPVIKMG